MRAAAAALQVPIRGTHNTRTEQRIAGLLGMVIGSVVGLVEIVWPTT